MAEWMSLNLIKLCVGCDSIQDLESWIAANADAARSGGFAYEQVATTRMMPKRRGEMDGGSLYWVIKGSVQVRQRLLDIAVFTDGEGIQRCRLVLDQTLVPTEWQPKRPFQGWRYLEDRAVPPDLPTGSADDLPPALRAELAALGLL